MTKKQQEQEQVFEQRPDGHGRVRLDRPLTAQEAAEQDAENRKRYLAERQKRFQGRG